MSSESFELKTKMFRAGAGAGKTTRLIREVLSLVHGYKKKFGTQPRILVTTFTRKATQELRERLIVEAQKIGDPSLEEYVSSKSSLLIATIHGVLSQFLTKYGSEIGLDADYQIVDEVEISRIARKILKKMVRQDSELGGLLEIYEFRILVPLVMSVASLLTIDDQACPVTLSLLQQLTHGKTRAWRETCLGLSTEILSATNDEKWLELAKKFNSLAEALGESDFSISRKRILDILAETKKPTYRRGTKAPVSEDLNERSAEVLKEISQLEETRFDPATWEEFVRVASIFFRSGKAFANALNKHKTDNGLITISDLEGLAFVGMKEYPETAKGFSESWDYWFIDEYQDTSPLQVDLIRLLKGERPHFVVGDPQQSIYFFRGARSEVFDLKLQEVKALPSGEVHELNNNYRSRSALMEFLNSFFSKYATPFLPMVPKPSDSPDELSEVAGVFYFGTQQLARIRDYIAEKIHQGIAPEQIAVLARTNRHLKLIATELDQIGVPVHVHSSSGFFDTREVKDALQILQFLILPYDNKNLIALLRSPWCYVEDGELGLFLDINSGGKKSYWTSFTDAKSNWSTNAQSVFNDLSLLLKYSREFGVSAAWEKALVDFGVWDHCQKHDLSGRREANLWKLVQRLKTMEQRSRVNYGDFIRTARDHVTAPDELTEGEASAVLEPSRVNLMTVHASKGLQFDIVVVPFCTDAPRLSNVEKLSFDEESHFFSVALLNEDEGGWQHSLLSEKVRDFNREQEAMESDRLLYVALTRAKRQVFVSGDGVVKPKSWVARMKINLDVGVHQENSFSYEVLGEKFDNDKAERFDENSDEGLSFDGKVPSTIETGEPALEARRFSVVNVTCGVRKKWLDVAGLKENNMVIADSSDVNPVSEESNSDSSANSITDLTGARNTFDKERVVEKSQMAYRGIVLHRIFESLRYQPDLDYKSLLKNEIPAQDVDKFIAAIEFALGQDAVPLSELLRQGHTEWGYQVRDEKGENHVGQIDLWGVVDNTVWIVDFKSGSARYLADAKVQLERYARALRRWHPNKKMNLAALFALEKKVFVSEFLDT